MVEINRWEAMKFWIRMDNGHGGVGKGRMEYSKWMMV